MSGLNTFNHVLLNLFPIGILILDQERNVICANRYCEELINDANNSDDAGRVPRQCIHLRDTRLRTFIEKVSHTAKAESSSPQFVTFHTGSERRLLEVVVIKHAPNSGSSALDTDARTIVLIQDANKYKPFCQQKLRQTYGLTQAEANIAIAILQGKNVEEIATERSVQANTVRMHLKQVFSKIGVRRQSELVWRLSNNWFLQVQTPHP